MNSRFLPFASAACFFTVSLAATSLPAQTAVTYQKPPAPIEQLLTAPQTPVARISPDRKTLLVEQPATFPTIADVALPRYRLAGLRFNPSTNGPSRGVYSVAMSLQPIDGSPARPIGGLPAKLKASDALWSPDSKHVAFVERVADTPETSALQLWVIDVATARAHEIAGVKLNAVLGRTPFEWMPSSEALLCKAVPHNRPAAPKPSDVPTGPHVSENLGKVTPAPTYEDMIQTPDDEAIFEYYATSQLYVVPLNGPVGGLPVVGLLDRVSASPNGRYALVTALHKPFSYTVPAERFPTVTEIVTLPGSGRSAEPRILFDRPVTDNLPISRDAVAPGPRDYEWRADAAATLVWVTAPEGDDPAKPADVRDRVMMSSAPFEAAPQVLLELPMHIARGYGPGAAGGIHWGTDHFAIVQVSRFSDRSTMMLAFDPSTPNGKMTVLYKGSSQDRYRSPGEPASVPNAAGKRVLAMTPDGSGIYFFSQGASRGGDKPFVATMPVAGGEETILWRSADPYYAAAEALLDGNQLLVRRESVTDAPNYMSVALDPAAKDFKPVTHFASPYAGIALPTKQLLHYKRADGVDLTATLWLPAGYDKSQGPLPMVMEAYPAEFKDRAAASQTTGSPNRFPRITWGSPTFFAQTGYAVFENAAIPIIGEGKSEPNDTYVEQLVDAAKSAIDYGASLGVVDPKRVAVMGHSYGAFMTANLLAHTTLFRAGIARSGAYNRTLTPFGFQNEERTYWQDPEVYYKMSPFSYADKIKTPILLIHGEADDNTGTYPIQTERFYAALKGEGATVRMVFLPLEAHGYEARETLEHVLWEESRWLDTYVKPAAPATQTASSGN